MADWENPLEKEIRKILEKIIKNFTIISEISPEEAQFFGYERIEITLPSGKKIIKERRTPSINNNQPIANIVEESQPKQDTSNFLSDVIQTSNEVIVIAEVPTLDEKEVNFEVKNGVVRIFCNNELIHEIKLEKEVDLTSIKEKFKNRILELRIPLKQKT